MSWHALDMLDDSFEATKRLLLPFTPKKWVILAIIVFFVGGTGGTNVNLGNIPSSVASGPGTGIFTGISGPGVSPEIAIPIVVFFVLIGVLLAFVLLFIRGIMEFVFVEVARTETVRIRGFFGDHLETGLQLFLFWIAIGFVVVATVLMGVFMTVITAGIFLLAVLLFSPVLVVAGFGLWIVLRFTIDFVVPVMIADNVNIVDGWQSFWSDLVGNWKQYGVYAVVRLLLGFVAGVAIGIGFAIIALALAIPFGIVGFGGLFLLVSVLQLETIGLVFGGSVLVVFIATVLVIGTIVVHVPVQTYLRYYGLFVLGAISPRFDLVEDIRTAIEDETAEAGTS